MTADLSKQPRTPGASGEDAPLAAAITAGGASRRFGSDKALHVLGGRTLLQRVADSLAGCAPRVLIAPDGRYDLPGWRGVPDRRPGEGPLAGLETALHEVGGWTAFAAVDLPHLTAEFWALLAGRRSEDVDAVIPLDALGRPQPLAALYHPRILPDVTGLLDGGERRMTALLSAVRVRNVQWSDIAGCGDDLFVNLNTPGATRE